MIKKTTSRYFILAHEPFFFRSRLDGRVMQGKSDGFFDMWTMDESNLNQMWVQSAYGGQIFNVGTGMPLKAGKGRSWTFDEAEGLIHDQRFPTEVIHRAWQQNDGANSGTWVSFGLPIQRFDKVAASTVPPKE